MLQCAASPTRIASSTARRLRPAARRASPCRSGRRFRWAQRRKSSSIRRTVSIGSADGYGLRVRLPPRMLHDSSSNIRQTAGGRGMNTPVRSNASPARKIVSSAKGGAIICIPIGRLFESYPHGIEMPGIPARFTEIVNMSGKYIVQRVVHLLANPEGGSRRDRRDYHIAFLERALEVVPDQRAHLLRFQIVRIIVAGREREGAEHDSPFHLGAETLVACGFYSSILLSAGTRRPKRIPS